MKEKLTLGVLITTMNYGIKGVKDNLLKQLQNLDEVVISHQITDKNIIPEKIKDLKQYHKNIKYTFMNEKGLSKNRNNAIKNSSSDICIICDDDLIYLDGFEKIIKNAYLKNIQSDIITFQAIDENNNRHFKVSEGKHNIFTILKIWSWGITFRRKNLIENKLFFDEKFGLGAEYLVGEENIFLKDAINKGLKLYHKNENIVFHKNESSGIDYNNRKDLIIARIKVFDRLFGKKGAFLAVFYFTILHYKYYKKYFSIREFFILSFKSFINAE